MRMFQNYKTLEIPNHSQITHQPYHFPQLMRYGKWVTSLPRFRFPSVIKVPLHSSYVKGDQRFVAIHQHKLPDLQGPFSNMITCDDIKKMPKIGIFSNMTLFFFAWFCFCLFVWLIAQITTTPTLASSQSSNIAA